MTDSQTLSKSSLTLNKPALLLLKPSSQFCDFLLDLFSPLGGLFQSAWNIPELDKQVFCPQGSLAQSNPCPDWPQLFPNTPHSHPSSTSRHNALMATLGFPKQLFESNPTPSFGALFSPCCQNRGRGSFEAVVLIYETCLWIWLLTAVVLT